MKLWLFLILVLVVSLAKIGYGLDCYHCEGFVDEERIKQLCVKPNATATSYAECEEEEVCINQKTLPIARELFETVIPKIVRGCRHKTFCQGEVDRSEHCYSCESNLCNHASLADSFCVSLLIIAFCVVR